MKRQNLIKLVFAASLLAASAMPAMAAGKPWEPVKAERAEARSVAREGELEIKIASGTIYVICNRQTSVKVYTILGQLVSSETLGPGVHQLRPASRGVYIVKAGGLTCKVAL